MFREQPRVSSAPPEVTRAFLAPDPLYGAYALGYLAPSWQNTTNYLVAFEQGIATALVVQHDERPQPALLVFGERRGLIAVMSDFALASWRAALRRRGQEVWLSGQDAALAALAGFFYTLEQRPLERHVVDAACFRLRPRVDPAAVSDEGRTRRLTTADTALLNQLYGLGADDHFAGEELARGAYYGTVITTQDGAAHCVAAAGTHVVAQPEGIVAIGNVYTLPNWRGRGHATACVAALCTYHALQGYARIVLNVDPGNGPALHIYHRLGFRCHSAFQEVRAIAL